jgi:hypothetical protein
MLDGDTMKLTKFNGEDSQLGDFRRNLITFDCVQVQRDRPSKNQNRAFTRRHAQGDLNEPISKERCEKDLADGILLAPEQTVPKDAGSSPGLREERKRPQIRAARQKAPATTRGKSWLFAPKVKRHSSQTVRSHLNVQITSASKLPLAH